MTYPPPSSPQPAQPAEPDNLEQTRALRAVHDAIDALHKTHADRAEVLVEWVLVTASHFDNGDGTTGTAYRINGLPLDNAPHRTAGLLHAGLSLGGIR